VPGLLLVAALALPACAGSGFDYVGSPDRKASFKVPLEWKEFTKRDLLAATGQDVSEATGDALPWLIGFDSAAAPTADHVLSLGAPVGDPVVLAQTLALDFATRDQVSLGTIRNQVYPIDELLNNNAAEILDYEELNLEGGLRGIRMEYDVHPEGITTVGPGNEAIRVLQIGILDARTENLYLFAIRCEASCYEEHAKLIQQIADSWTVKEQ
jgi:hypothetical protein